MLEITAVTAQQYQPNTSNEQGLRNTGCGGDAHLLCVGTQTNWCKRLLPALNAKMDHHHAEVVGEVVREEMPPSPKKQSVRSRQRSDTV